MTTYSIMTFKKTKTAIPIDQSILTLHLITSINVAINLWRAWWSSSASGSSVFLFPFCFPCKQTKFLLPKSVCSYSHQGAMIIASVRVQTHLAFKGADRCLSDWFAECCMHIEHHHEEDKYTSVEGWDWRCENSLFIHSLFIYQKSIWTHPTGTNKVLCLANCLLHAVQNVFFFIQGESCYFFTKGLNVKGFCVKSHNPDSNTPGFKLFANWPLKWTGDEATNLLLWLGGRPEISSHPLTYFHLSVHKTTLLDAHVHKCGFKLWRKNIMSQIYFFI